VVSGASRFFYHQESKNVKELLKEMAGKKNEVYF